jgi:hypothetical protein
MTTQKNETSNKPYRNRRSDGLPSAKFDHEFLMTQKKLQSI